MKDKRDLNYILRWNNGYGDDLGNIYPYTFWIEDKKGNKVMDITDEKALNFIKNKTTNAFRNLDIYKNHIELFKILGIKNEKKSI